MNRKVSIRFTVVSLFIFATLLTAAIAIALQFYFSKKLATEYALESFSSTSDQVGEFIRGQDLTVSNIAQLLSTIYQYSGIDTSFSNSRNIYSELLLSNPMVYSIYRANYREDFFQLINMEAHPLIKERLNAQVSDRWLLVKITGEKPNRYKELIYFDEDFNQRYYHKEPSNYYPSSRPWYQGANRSSVNKTSPYLFQQFKVAGQTFSVELDSGDVIGVDIMLSSVSNKMKRVFGPLLQHYDLEAFIFDGNGEIVARSKDPVPRDSIPMSRPLFLTEKQKKIIQESEVIRISNQNDWAPMDFAMAGEPSGYAIDLLNVISDMTGIKFQFINGFSWSDLVHQYNRGRIDMLHSLQHLKNGYVQGVFSEPLYQMPFSVVTKSGVENIGMIARLNNKKIAMLDFWSIIPTLEANYPDIELVKVSSIQEGLNAVENGEVFGMIDSDIILKRSIQQWFLDEFYIHQDIKEFNKEFSGAFHVVAHPEQAELVKIINLAISNVSEAQWVALHNKWLVVKDGLPSAEDHKVVPYQSLVEMAKDHNQLDQLVLRESNGKSYYVYVTTISTGVNSNYFSVIVPKSEITYQVWRRISTSVAITLFLLFSLIPIAWGLGYPIVKPILFLKEQTLKVKNRKHKSVELVDSRIKEIWDLSNSIKHMAVEIEKHEQQREAFVESFIRLIAQAIDDKSAYTAGHCNRVPELALMLVAAAEKSEDEPYKEFKFASEEEYKEFRIAAWLHDCGKVTTPEYVVDKGSKLEANYNRIHEIRTRFEVLLRDAEITYLLSRISNPEETEQALKRFELEKVRLKEEFEFVARSNVGGEFMSQDDINRLNEISEKTWIRHFDSSLGLSPMEETKHIQVAPVPAVEKLLADKPEHIVYRQSAVEYDPRLGIDVEVPEYMYNYGELYNLSIKKGTLNTEERFKINEHIISTIKILDQLPFPKELERVPRYASTHHETMKGTGYPRKLKGEDLSIPERILAIADVFEALTAADRPYKKAKPLSVAVNITFKMCLEGHLDINAFQLMLSSGVYLDYARKFLPESQIDEVDLDKYLTPRDQFEPELSYA